MGRPVVAERHENRIAHSETGRAEVIRAGLRLLKEEEQWRAEARQQIAEGLADHRVGRSIEGDEVLEQLMKSIADKRRKGARAATEFSSKA